MLDRNKQIQGLLDSIHIIQRIFLTHLGSYAKRTDISIAQLLVLRIVGQHDGISVKEIAHQMGLTSSAITQVVNILVKKGYLIRQENPVDRRALKIRLSDRGGKQLEVLQKLTVENLLDVFDDEELLEYCALNKKISARFTVPLNGKGHGEKEAM